MSNQDQLMPRVFPFGHKVVPEGSFEGRGHNNRWDCRVIRSRKDVEGDYLGQARNV